MVRTNVVLLILGLLLVSAVVESDACPPLLGRRKIQGKTLHGKDGSNLFRGSVSSRQEEGEDEHSHEDSEGPENHAPVVEENGPTPSASKEEADEVVPKLLGDEWKPIRNYPIGVSEAQGAILTHDGRKFLLVAGGYLYKTNYEVTNVTYTFELNDGKDGTEWERRADMPMILTHMAQVAVGHKLFTCGGFEGNHPGPSVQECFVYDLAADEWRSLPPLPHRRAGGAIVYIRKMDALFFAGGADREAGEEQGVDHADTYLLRLNQQWKGWEQRAEFDNPRNHMSAVEVNGRYFFIGGQHGANEETGNQANLDEYVAQEDKWYRRKDMPFGVGHVSASTPAWTGGFLVVGGVKDDRVKSKQVLFYDMLDDSWREVGQYVTGIQTPVCGVVENNIICATGAGDVGDWSEAYIRSIGHA